MISSLLHLVGLRPRVNYTLTNFRGGGQGPLAPLPSMHQWYLLAIPYCIASLWSLVKVSQLNILLNVLFQEGNKDNMFLSHNHML